MTPPPLPPSARPRPAVSHSLLWTVIARLVMFGIFSVAVALVGWSLYQFYVTVPPLGRQIQQKDSERTSLSAEVQTLEMNWNATAAEKLEAEYRGAQELLFTSEAEQEKWAAEIAARARQLALDIDVQWGSAEKHPNGPLPLNVRPALLRIQPTRIGGGLTNSPYERLLQLAALLETHSRRVDLTALSISSDSNSVAQAQMKFQLWADAREKGTP